MRDINSIIVRSEFRLGTSKIFKNSEDPAIEKNLSNEELIIASARAAFFDIPGIEEMEIIKELLTVNH